VFPGDCPQEIGTANPDGSIFVAHGGPFVGYGKPYPWNAYLGPCGGKRLRPPKPQWRALVQGLTRKGVRVMAAFVEFEGSLIRELPKEGVVLAKLSSAAPIRGEEDPHAGAGSGAGPAPQGVLRKLSSPSQLSPKSYS
jgi:hypothetical protein